LTAAVFGTICETNLFTLWSADTVEPDPLPMDIDGVAID
jgi:hypothetical protein